MVFRSRFARPKPNLAAAKKSSVVDKQAADGAEDVKPAINEKPVPTIVVLTASPGAVPASLQSGSRSSKVAGDRSKEEPSETSQLVNRASPVESRVIEPPEDASSLLIPTEEPATPCRIEEPPAEKTSLNIPVEHVSRAVLPCADKSDGERDESPLFVPKPSAISRPMVEIINLTPNYVPPPVQNKPKVKRRGPVPFHRTDLDDADSEDSDSKQSVLSEAARKRRNLEETLIGSDTRRQPMEPRYRPQVRRLGEDDSAPMDRSSVTMKDLIYYTNRNKPPPAYRQEREMKQYGKSGCSWYQEESGEKSREIKEDRAEVIFVIPNAESTSSLAEDPGAGADSDLKGVKEEKVKDEKEKDEKTAEEKSVKEEKPKKESGGQAQFVMDADGNIVINEESLVIRREYDEDYIDIQQDGVIGSATYSSFRKCAPRSKKWSLRETIRLYKALSTVGTDFSFMSRLFKHRTREEIKKKFKREEKARPNFIDRVLSNRKHFDLSILDDTSDSDSSTTSNESKEGGLMIKDALREGNPRRFRKSKKNYRRVKHYKKIDVPEEELPANPKWHYSRTVYCEGEPSAKRPRVDNAEVQEMMSNAVENYQRKYTPSRPVSRGSSTGGMEDVLTRLIDQKMKDLNERDGVRVSRAVSPPPPQPTVRNRSLSLNDFCKHEANLKS